jgi:hypothetical protein
MTGARIDRRAFFALAGRRGVAAGSPSAILAACPDVGWGRAQTGGGPGATPIVRAP